MTAACRCVATVRRKTAEGDDAPYPGLALVDETEMGGTPAHSDALDEVAGPRPTPRFQRLQRRESIESERRGAPCGAPLPQTPLERRDVDGLRALVAGLGVVLHLCALCERLEAVTGDAGVMDEEVLPGLVRRNKAEALVVVEPLHSSGGHV